MSDKAKLKIDFCQYTSYTAEHLSPVTVTVTSVLRLMRLSSFGKHG